MQTTLAALLILVPLVGQTQAALVNPGFDITKPGSGGAIGGVLNGGGVFDSYVQGTGTNLNIVGTVGTATWNDTTSGSIADILGWSPAPGKSNTDTAKNGVGGSPGLNIFAAWGGQQRVIGQTTDVFSTGATYIISAQIQGGAGSPIEQALAFDLMANGIVLTADAPLTSFTGGPSFQTITQTYTNVALPGGVSEGDPLSILLGVDDSNTAGGRLVWDDVAIDVALAAIPEPSSSLLLSIGGLALILRRRK